MTETDNRVPDSNDNAAPQQEPVAETASAPVDLAAEAGQAAAATPQPTEGRVRSLDDLDVDGAVRAQIESYVSKSVNEAVSKHDERQQRKLDDEGFMNKAQIEQLLETKDAEYARREQAKDTFLTVLGTEGITPGSEDYTKVQAYYQKAVNDGSITPHILLSEAGIRTLTMMAGVGTPSAQSAGPRSGLTKTAPAPDGSVVFADGTTQLNVRAEDEPTLEERVRRAVGNSVNPSS